MSVGSATRRQAIGSSRQDDDENAAQPARRLHRQPARQLPANLLAAYLDGEFVNLTSGSVYPEFDRALNGSSEDIKTASRCTSAWISTSARWRRWSRPARCRASRGRRADHDPRHAGDDCGDQVALRGARDLRLSRCFGNSRKSNNASESDIALLRAARFTVMVAPSNPAVKDRVLAFNQMIHDREEVEKGGLKMLVDRRRYRVNVDKCPGLVECLEKQAYDKNGEPDKASDLDHENDAAGYFVFYRYPVRGREMKRLAIGGV
jgi:hypothetical protein